MNWIALQHLLDQTPNERPVTLQPALDHAQLRQQALRLAGGLQARGVRRIAVHLEDAAELALPAPVATEPAPTQAEPPASAPATARTPAAPTTGAGIGDGSRYLLQAGAFQASGQAEELRPASPCWA